jgi:hypothetical protein
MLKPDQVVDVTVAASSGALWIQLAIHDGYHIMSDRPSQPNFIATVVKIDPIAGMKCAPPRYSPADTFVLDGQAIAVFEGRAVAELPCSPPPAPGTRIRGTVRYQSCTDGACLPPTIKTFGVNATTARH